jgi:predicted Zn finger-like uncharacterized protein
MLITTCAHCHARFRVSPQQLNVKQGQVRCGKCQQVFSGFQSLVRVPDDDTGARLLALREREEAAARAIEEPLPPVEDLSAELGAPHGLDLEVEPEPRPAPSAPQPAAEPPRFAPVPQLTFDAPLPARRLSRAWSAGVVLLSLVLASELAYAYRSTIAQRYPPLRPPLEAACAWIECTVPWARDNASLKLEESDLLEVPGRPGEIALTARIRNLGSEVQEYPHLELTLTDLGGQVAVRRVLRPVDYLGRALVRGDVLPPGNEILLQLRLEVPRVKATGYELLLFYP